VRTDDFGATVFIGELNGSFDFAAKRRVCRFELVDFDDTFLLHIAAQYCALSKTRSPPGI